MGTPLKIFKMADSGVNYAIYDDDCSFGEAAPAIDSVELLAGEQAGFVAGKVNVIHFWAKWDKASYAFHKSILEMSQKHGDALFVHAISCDPQKEYATGFMTKDKYVEFGQHLTQLAETGNGAVSWDNGKAVFKAYKELIDVMAMNLPHMFVVDGEFFTQVDHAVAGEPMELTTGPTPEIEFSDDDSDSDGEGGIEVDGDDFALF